MHTGASAILSANTRHDIVLFISPPVHVIVGCQSSYHPKATVYSFYKSFVNRRVAAPGKLPGIVSLVIEFLRVTGFVVIIYAILPCEPSKEALV